jgi:hypothetical protein
MSQPTGPDVPDELRAAIREALGDCIDPDDDTMAQPSLDEDEILVMEWVPAEVVILFIAAAVQPIVRAKVAEEIEDAEERADQAEAALGIIRAASDRPNLWAAAVQAAVEMSAIATQAERQRDRLRTAWQSARQGRRSARLLARELERILRREQSANGRDGLILSLAETTGERDRLRAAVERVRDARDHIARNRQAAVDDPKDYPAHSGNGIYADAYEWVLAKLDYALDGLAPPRSQEYLGISALEIQPSPTIAALDPPRSRHTRPHGGWNREI